MGLIIPRNPLVYPGGNPGFNPNHIAVKGGLMRYSGVATSNGSMRSLLNPTPPTILGTPNFVMDGLMGPTFHCPESTTAGVLIPGAIETPTAVTMAFILSTDGLGASNNAHIFGTNGNNAGGITQETSLYITVPGGTPFLFVNGVVLSPLNVVPTGKPVFVALSYSNAGVLNFVVRQLSGQKFNVTSTSVGATTIQTPVSSGYMLGFANSTTFAAGTKFAAAAYIINNFIQAPQLMEWAANPWDFWYPPTVRQALVSSGGIKPANSLSFALTDPVEAAAFTLTEKDQLHFALTDPVETAAFALTEKDQFHFVLTDVVETAAFSLSKIKGVTFALTDAVETASFTLTEKDQFHFALTDAVEAAAFSLANVKSISFALTDAVETATFHLADGKSLHFALTDAIEAAHFTLTDHAPVPQPGPQAAFPLRERTYRRRFVGVGYDPRFTVSKDRPGPLRIIEFIGEIKE